MVRSNVDIDVSVVVCRGQRDDVWPVPGDFGGKKQDKLETFVVDGLHVCLVLRSSNG